MRALVLVLAGVMVASLTVAYAGPKRSGLDPAEISARVERYYAAAPQATVRFEQRYWNQAFQRPTTSNGTLRVKSPGKMRWDYEARGKQVKSFIADGKHLWMIDMPNKQAARQPMRAALLPVAVSFLMGQGNLTSQFAVELTTSGTFGAKSDLVLELTPKKPSAQFSKLWLVVDATDYHVKESIVREASGNENRFVFGAVDQNRSVKSGYFVVSRKALVANGYTIIR